MRYGEMRPGPPHARTHTGTQVDPRVFPLCYFALCSASSPSPMTTLVNTIHTRYDPCSSSARSSARPSPIHSRYNGVILLREQTSISASIDTKLLLALSTSAAAPPCALGTPG